MDAARLKAQLAARGYALTDVPSPQEQGAAPASARASAGSSLQVSVTVRHQVETAAHGTLDVAVPIALGVRLDAHGDLLSVAGGTPSHDEIAAAETGLHDLIDAGQLDDPDHPPRKPRATHVVERAADGCRLVRRRHVSGG